MAFPESPTGSSRNSDLPASRKTKSGGEGTARGGGSPNGEVAAPSPRPGSVPQILASPQMQAKPYSHISTIRMVCKQMGAAGSCFTPCTAPTPHSPLASRAPPGRGGPILIFSRVHLKNPSPPRLCLSWQRQGSAWLRERSPAQAKIVLLTQPLARRCGPARHCTA